MSVEKQPAYVVIVDTETTGLPHDADARVISWALLVAEDKDGTWEPVYVDQGYVMPSVWSRYADKAEAIHRIPYQRLVTEGRSEAEVAEYFIAIDSKYKPKWTSFNKRFDLEMLNRLGFTPAQEGECIMQMAAAALRLKKRTVALKTAYADLVAKYDPSLAWDDTAHHNAGYDAVAAYRVWLRCVAPSTLPF